MMYFTKKYEIFKCRHVFTYSISLKTCTLNNASIIEPVKPCSLCENADNFKNNLKFKNLKILLEKQRSPVNLSDFLTTVLFSIEPLQQTSV